MELSRRQQERIFCRCQSYDMLCDREKEKIKNACKKTGYADAVFEYITTDASSGYVSGKYYISEKWLAVKTAEVFKALAR